MTDQTNTEQGAPSSTQAKWLKEITQAEEYFSDWFEKADKIIRLYRRQDSQSKSKRRFAMLWANVEVLKPTVYSRMPEPAVVRRFKDRDPAGRVACEILERAASYQFEAVDLDDAIKGARDDMLLPGRGVAWVRYVSDGKLAVDYIHWRDFLHKPGRRWKEVTWLAKRSWFSKDELQRRFELDKEKLATLSPDSVPKSSGMSDEEKKALEGKYSVWEIWDKTTGKVYFISPCCTQPLEELDPFLSLTDFWPCPRPIFATMTTDSLIPVPDYKYYQDQAEEVDDLTRRIASLTDSLKRVGFYPRGDENAAAIERSLKPGVENEMIGVESWAAFSEKSRTGLPVVFLPIKEVVETIRACVELRTQLIQDVFQITGISDIMRGSTDPNETLGAQQLKAQTGSIRVRDRQQEIQRFARDITRICCEIMAEKFSPAVLLEMSNQNTQENNTPEKKQQLEQAFQLMRNDQLRGFRIDIETDSTVQLDENAEKDKRVEFVTALGTFLKEAMPIAQAQPQMLPMLGEALRFTVRGFRAGRQLEDVIDRTIDQMEQAAQQAQTNPQPSPEEQQAQMEMKKAETELAMKGKEAEANLAMKGQELQMKREEHVMDMQFRREENAMDMQTKQQGAAIDLRNKVALANQQMRATAQKQAMQPQRPVMQ